MTDRFRLFYPERKQYLKPNGIHFTYEKSQAGIFTDQTPGIGTYLTWLEKEPIGTDEENKLDGAPRLPGF